VNIFPAEPSKIASQIQEMAMNKAILETGELSLSGSDSNPSEVIPYLFHSISLNYLFEG